MESLLEQVIGKAKEAGKIVMDYYMKEYTIEQKANNTPVTDADLASEQFLQSELQKIVDCPVLGEETAKNGSYFKSDTLWIVDPLDGTKDFIGKTGDFSVMIGLVMDGSPVLGVIYAPTKDLLYFAAQGLGAYKSVEGRTELIHVAEARDPLRLVTSRNNLTPLDEYIAANIGRTERIKSGSFGLKTGLIAEGKSDFYFTSNGNASEWDTCASEILIKEAGGRITDFSGGSLQYNQLEKGKRNGVLVTNGQTHDYLLQNIQNLQATYNPHL